jgi:trans-aconitate 2-methyltransferase
MPSWNAAQYLKFADERTRPCRDLVAAIALPHVHWLIDLGCGPGNSTRVLADRWPDAKITGLDNATAMIDVARTEQPQHRWIVRDIAEWAANEREQFDLVFSNAALQWVEDHVALYPKLMQRVAPGGAFAAQIPADFDALPHRLMRELVPPGVVVREWHSHTPGFYYDTLAPHALRVDVWETEYRHVMPSAAAIVEWYQGSGLRPFMEAISEERQREKFLSNFTERIRDSYQPQPDGRVLFPFRRLFVVAYAKGVTSES